MTQPIRYRPTGRQFPWWLLAFPAIAGLADAAMGVDDPASWAMHVVTTTVFAAEASWLMTVGVELTDEALVMRGVRRRVIPWRRIEWIGPTRHWGATMVGVRHGGRLHRLRAPYHQRFLAPDPDFEAKARTIYETWVRATSTGYGP